MRICLVVLALLAAHPVWAREDGTVPPDGEAIRATTTTEDRGRAYTHMMRALLSVKRGEFSVAAREIDRAIEFDRDSPELLVEAARLLEWTGRRSDAERLARRSLELDPDRLESIRFVADVAARRALGPKKEAKSRSEAMRLYGRLVELDPQVDPDVLGMLTTLQQDAGDIDAAIATARLLVGRRPGDVQASRLLVQLLLREQREGEALDVLLRYVAAHPFDEEMLGFAVQLTRNLDAWSSAAQILAAEAPFPPEIAAIQRFYAETLLRLGRNDEAVATIQRALEGREDDARLRQDLAVAYTQAGRRADAVEILHELVREAPDYPFFYQLLGETLAEQGQLRQAGEALAFAVDSMGTNEQMASQRDAIRRRMIALALRQDDLLSAATHADALELPDRTSAVRSRIDVALAAERWSEARQLVRELRDAGDVGYAEFLDGRIALSEGRAGKARGKFAEAIERLGPRIRWDVAQAFAAADRFEEGLDVLESWIEAEPSSADARYLTGVYVYEERPFESAEPLLREALRLDPDHAPALNFLGYSLAERGLRLDEAQAMIQRALESDPWNGAYLDSLGWVYYQMGRYAEARGPLEQAARELPSDPTVLEHLGDVYAELGIDRRAVSSWLLAIEAGAEDPGSVRAKIEALDASAARAQAPGGEPSADRDRMPSLPRR